MMLVGTSLGGCLKSLALGEVSVDDVLVIITRTSCPDLEQLISVVKSYYEYGNVGARQRSSYDLSDCDLDTIIEIASDLYRNGKIHQPRLFNGFGGFVHVELSRKEIWIPLAPSPKTDDERVIDAYEKYKVLRNLLS
jgi:hypothetical protein